MELVSFQNDFMEAVLAVGHTLEMECARMIYHGIKPCRTLVSKQYGSRCWLVSKKLSMPQKLCAAVQGGKTFSGIIVLMQRHVLGQFLHKCADKTTLF